MWATIYNRGQQHYWLPAESARYMRSRCGRLELLKNLQKGDKLPNCRICNKEKI